MIQLCPWEPHPRDPSTSNESVSTSQHNRCSDAHHGAVTWACGPDWRKASQTTSCPPSTSRPSLHPPPAVFTPAWGSCSGRPMPSSPPHPAVPFRLPAPVCPCEPRCSPPGARGTVETSRPSVSPLSSTTPAPAPRRPPAVALLAGPQPPAGTRLLEPRASPSPSVTDVPCLPIALTGGPVARAGVVLGVSCVT